MIVLHVCVAASFMSHNQSLVRALWFYSAARRALHDNHGETTLLAVITTMARLKLTCVQAITPPLFYSYSRTFICSFTHQQEWNGRREITEKTFKFDGKTIPSLIGLVVIFPGFIYFVMKDELVRASEVWE